MKISKSAIFLFELMFVILVFTVSAAICANIFGQSYNYSRDSKNLTQAIIIAESAAENFKADTNLQKPHEQTEYYDGSWESTTKKDESAHQMKISVTVKDRVAVCDIVFDSGLYKLTAKKALVE